MWRVDDGKQMATVEADDVRRLAVSKDGRWIAAGTDRGNVFVWDAKTYAKVISYWDCSKAYHSNSIEGVDFSPDSTCLVFPSSWSSACILNIATRQEVQTLDHGRERVTAAKYSPQGDRIATVAFRDSVQVWDSNDGRLLVHIPVGVDPDYNTGLLWSNNHLFTVSDHKIKEFEASTGLTISEWSVVDRYHCTWSIALPQHREFIAYSTERTVTFCTHTQLGLIQHTQDIRSIALSPDDRFLAMGGEGGKITIKNLSRITVSILSRRIVVQMNNCLAPILFSLAFNPFVLCTPHIQGTKYSDRRRCAPLLEAQSTRKRGSIIDCRNTQVSESKPCIR